MNFITNYIKYLKDNPERYWFKRKLYGWGWVPARWQGWATLSFFILFFISNSLTLEGDISTNEIEAKWFFIKLLLGVFALIWICYKTGESPRWQWGKVTYLKDVIVVLASGVNNDGSLPNEPKSRIKEGVRLWKSGVAKKIIMSGKYSFWLDERKQIPPRTEAEAMKEYAESLGVPAEDIILEGASQDTLGNAYFTKVDILMKNRWKDVTVVTSPFHIPRTKYIFDTVLGPDYKIEYVASADNFTPEDNARLAKTESRTIEVLKEMFGDIKAGDTEAIGKMIFTKHPGYSKNPEISFDQLKEMLGRNK